MKTKKRIKMKKPLFAKGCFAKGCFSKGYFSITPLALALSASLMSGTALGEDEFDATIWGGGSVLDVDFARFNQKNAVMPGEYDADVYVNGSLKGRETLRFEDNPETGRAELCLTPGLQEVLDLEAQAIALTGSDERCIPIKQAIPDADAQYKSDEIKLDVEIAQALTIRRPRDYVSPSRWQTGTTAGFVNYDLNYYRYSNLAASSDSLYLGLRTGFNLGNWALRHNGSLSWYQTKDKNGFGDKAHSGYQRGETYLQRDFAALRGNLTIGDFYTAGQVGENFGLRGIRLASDDRMLAPSQRGFAPVVRGVANSNAKVSIKQNGRIIYEISVPAGPFVISDLYPSGYNGDLLVEIQESNGQIRSFTVPYSNVAPLIRQGHFRYQIAGGRYRHYDNRLDDVAYQGIVQYGLLNNLTVNSAINVAHNYHAAVLGVGFNTPIGAFSADSTWSYARFPAQGTTKKGYSLHGTYSINFNSTKTNIMLAAYRYSSRDYYSMSETFSLNEVYRKFSGAYIIPNYYRPKNQYQFSINQNLGRFGDIYLSGHTYTYWGQSGTRHQYQVSYANRFKLLSYQLSLSQTLYKETDFNGVETGKVKRDNGVYLSVSLPLGNNHSADSSYSRSNGSRSFNTGLNGSFGEQHQWSYGVNFSKDNRGYQSLGGNMGYQGAVGSYRANYSQDNRHNRQMGFGMNGSIVAHKHGITLGQQVGDSFAIIHAKDGKGALISSGSNRRIDYFGNGIVPYTTPYAVNYVSIDPKDVEANVEFSATEAQIVPRANSINLVDFTTHKNVMVLFNLEQGNGEPVPMAATAYDEANQFIGYVVQGGVLFAGRLTKEKGRLNVQWGPNSSERCGFDYEVDLETGSATQAKSYEAVCR